MARRRLAAFGTAVGALGFSLTPTVGFKVAEDVARLRGREYL